MSVVTVDQTEPAEEASFTSRNFVDYVPGVLLLIAVGLLGKYAQIGWKSLAHHEHWTVPDIEYVLWAIVIGLLVTNTIGLHRIFRAGVQTYEFWLKIGIVALGVRFVIGDVVKLGGIGTWFARDGGPWWWRSSDWLSLRLFRLDWCCSLPACCTGVSAPADHSGACAPSIATARASRA